MAVILFVEDDVVSRRNIALFLRLSGNEVYEAENGEMASACYRVSVVEVQRIDGNIFKTPKEAEAHGLELAREYQTAAVGFCDNERFSGLPLQWTFLRPFSLIILCLGSRCLSSVEQCLRAARFPRFTLASSLIKDRFQQTKPLHLFMHYSPSAPMVPVRDS